MLDSRFWPALIAMDARHIPTKTCGGLANQTLRCSRLFQASAPYSRVWTPAVPLLEQEGGGQPAVHVQPDVLGEIAIAGDELGICSALPTRWDIQPSSAYGPGFRCPYAHGAKALPVSCRQNDHSGAAVSPKLLPHPRVPGPPTT